MACCFTGRYATDRSIRSEASIDSVPASAPQICLLGHSTGCQDVVHYLRTGKLKKYVVSAVLQAPVSDRESILTLPKECQDAVQPAVDMARQMVEEDRGNDWLPRHLTRT